LKVPAKQRAASSRAMHVLQALSYWRGPAASLP